MLRQRLRFLEQKRALPEKAYKNVSETGDAVLPTLRNMLLKVDKRSFAEHSKVIIIGEELASTINLQQTLDFSKRIRNTAEWTALYCSGSGKSGT